MTHHTSFDDYSLLAEVLEFFGADVKEGVAAVREKWPPRFPICPVITYIMV
jgi:hypothetical protein